MIEPLILPRRTLLVLCGSTGSGKSTFAAQRFPATNIVASDHCRALVCDDENEQRFSKDAFDLFYYILRKRMLNGFFCVADSTALTSQVRKELRSLSRHYGYYGCLLILMTPPEICIQRIKQRVRQVPDEVVRYHTSLLPQVLEEAPKEGWERIRIVREDERAIEIMVETEQ
ncbi:MAG TPA: AAA family ATPase [Ktedonobacteraceae bacterium]|jgi:protein phosphatase